MVEARKGFTEKVTNSRDGHSSEDEGNLQRDKLAEQVLLGAWGMGCKVAAAFGTWKGSGMSWVMMRCGEAAAD